VTLIGNGENVARRYESASILTTTIFRPGTSLKILPVSCEHREPTLHCLRGQPEVLNSKVGVSLRAQPTTLDLDP
jgi:hypothetical protein